MIENTSLYLAFVAASIVLIAIPGPNVAVIVANSATYGLRYGLVTVAGTSSAMVIQLAVTVMGLTGILTVAAHSFEILRGLGVTYLLYLATEAWFAPSHEPSTRAQEKSARQMYVRGFLVSLGNPKTLLFYAAFLPQFVPAGADTTASLAVLSATFLALAVALDCCWAVLAHNIRFLISGCGRWLNRMTAGVLAIAAASLALVRRA